MKNIKYAVCYLVIILMASIPLFNNYLIRGHDIYFHLMRIEGLAQGLGAGEFPVRIQPTWYDGYGYAVSVFYSDLFLYPAALLRLLGISLQDAYKVYVVLCNVATTLISGYSFGKIFRKREIGVFGSCLYTLAPYRLVNLYTRGALGEYTGMIFWPLLIYACVLLLNEDRNKVQLQKGAVLMGISMAGMLQSHMLTAEIACMVLLLLVVVYCRRIFHKEVMLAGCGAVAAALGLSAWFLIPFLDYMLFGRFNINSIRNNDIMIQRQGTFLSQVFAIFDNAVGQSLDAGAGTAGDFTQGAGLSLMLSVIILMLLCIWGYLKQEERRNRQITITAAGLGVLMVVMSTLYFPWDRLCRISRIFRYIIVKIQFPWRFTGVAVGLLVVVWCAVLNYTEREYDRRKKVITICLAVGILLLSVGHFVIDLNQRAERIQVRSVEEMDTFVASGEEYLPVDTVLDKLKTQELYKDDSVEISDVVYRGTSITMHVKNTSAQQAGLELPRLYYAGYQALEVTDEGQHFPIEVTDGTNHVIKLMIPEQTEGNITLSFREPWYWRLAEIITLLSAGIVILYTYKIWTREKLKNE
ncbi:MAG: 6-pyruvoyl-tetrahydropterin synthase-related protein [Lachnospiraceae bacterium]